MIYNPRYDAADGGVVQVKYLAAGSPFFKQEHKISRAGLQRVNRNHGLTLGFAKRVFGLNRNQFATLQRGMFYCGYNGSCYATESHGWLSLSTIFVCIVLEAGAACETIAGK